MIYLVLFILLFLAMPAYFRVADKYNIIDKPNHRSSHDTITLRGGGIVFWFAALVFFMLHLQTSYLFFMGITLICLVSFWDDVQSLPNKVRIAAHFIAITLIFLQLQVFHLLPAWAVIACYVFAIGIINAYNFMDGINGITGCYTLVVLGSMLYTNQYVSRFADPALIVFPMIASVVFLYFNFRKKAKCFAGDVGSIGIAFWLIYLLLQLILQTGSLIWLLFLAVYGVDAVCTILHRLYLRQNIFKAHRLHFYQVLSNQYRVSHRIVSVCYALLQALVSAIVLLSNRKFFEIILFAVVLIPLLLVYLIKFYLLNKYENANKIIA